MARVKLTAGRVRDFTCENGKPQSFLWDTEAPGLAVRATPSGARSYVFQGKLSDKTIRITIGDVSTWNIEGVTKDADGRVVSYGAREEARRLQALIDQKIDPRHAKAEEIAAVEAKRAEQIAKEEADQVEAQRREMRVSAAWAAYIDHQKDKMQRQNIERGKKWGERHLQDHERMAQAGGMERKRSKELTKPGPLYPLLQMRLADINAEALKEWQRTEAETRPNNARQGFEMFRAFWRWCAGRAEYAAVIDTEAVEDKDLRDEVPARKPKEADALSREQLAAWFGAVRNIGNSVISAYLQCLLLTGARREEMASLRWADVDFKWKRMTIKDKVEGERIIPLTPYVESLLSELRRINSVPSKVADIRGRRGKEAAKQKKQEPSPWVFSSPAAKDGKLSEPRLAHQRALKVAGLPHVSIHGLRRTFASMAEWQAELPTGVVAQIMGHKPSATAEKHYKRRPLDLLRDWHSKYETWILEQAKVEFKAETEDLKLVAIDEGKAA